MIPALNQIQLWVIVHDYCMIVFIYFVALIPYSGHVWSFILEGLSAIKYIPPSYVFIVEPLLNWCETIFFKPSSLRIIRLQCRSKITNFWIKGKKMQWENQRGKCWPHSKERIVTRSEIVLFSFVMESSTVVSRTLLFWKLILNPQLSTTPSRAEYF